MQLPRSSSPHTCRGAKSRAADTFSASGWGGPRGLPGMPGPGSTEDAQDTDTVGLRNRVAR